MKPSNISHTKEYLFVNGYFLSTFPDCSDYVGQTAKAIHLFVSELLLAGFRVEFPHLYE